MKPILAAIEQEHVTSQKSGWARLRDLYHSNLALLRHVNTLVSHGPAPKLDLRAKHALLSHYQDTLHSAMRGSVDSTFTRLNMTQTQTETQRETQASNEEYTNVVDL